MLMDINLLLYKPRVMHQFSAAIVTFAFNVVVL